MTALCITTDFGSPFRPCVVKGAHLTHCDGYERARDEDSGQTRHTYDIAWVPDLGRNERTLRPCPGCLPRPAESGRLCGSHAARLRDVAGARVPELVRHLWALFDGGTGSDERVSGGSSESQWALSEARIAASEILDALGVRWSPEWSPAQAGGAVASILGGGDLYHATAEQATRAVRLVEAVERAFRRFPQQESAKQVPGVRCPSCGRLALMWHPPFTRRDDVAIRCARCDATQTQEWLEAVLGQEFA